MGRFLKFILLIALIVVGTVIYEVLLTASGFKGKLLCSEVFVSDRHIDEVLTSDLHSAPFWYLTLFESNVTSNPNLVITTFLGSGVAKSEALHRKGLGCTLVKGGSVDDVLNQRMEIEEYTPVAEIVDDAEIERNIHNLGVDKEKLQQAVDDAFTERNPEKPVRTRAVLIQYKGQTIAEKYADGFTANTKFNGWSMTKTVMNTLAGILVHQGRINLEKDSLFKEWADDERADITLEHLLHMNSGLAFNESYVNPLGDAVQILYNSYSTAGYARDKETTSKPGEVWNYSSGTSNLVSQAIREHLADDDAYVDLVYKDFFKETGMSSALMEMDASGTFVASSYLFATARDFAKFGQLYVNDGMVNGKRILPEGWVAYSTEAAEGSDGKYASHLWKKIPKTYTRAETDYSGIPQDAFFFLGYQGQSVTVIPSMDLVIVRFGLSRGMHIWDLTDFIRKIVVVFEQPT